MLPAGNGIAIVKLVAVDYDTLFWDHLYIYKTIIYTSIMGMLLITFVLILANNRIPKTDGSRPSSLVFVRVEGNLFKAQEKFHIDTFYFLVICCFSSWFAPVDRSIVFLFIDWIPSKFLYQQKYLRSDFAAIHSKVYSFIISFYTVN